MKIRLEGINRRTLHPSTNGQKGSFVKYNSKKNVKGIRLKVNTIVFFKYKHTSDKNIIRFSSFKNDVN